MPNVHRDVNSLSMAFAIGCKRHDAHPLNDFSLEKRIFFFRFLLDLVNGVFYFCTKNKCAFRLKNPNYLSFNVFCISILRRSNIYFYSRPLQKTIWNKCEFKVFVSVSVRKYYVKYVRHTSYAETHEMYVKVFRNNKWHKGLRKERNIYLFYIVRPEFKMWCTWTQYVHCAVQQQTDSTLNRRRNKTKQMVSLKMLLCRTSVRNFSLFNEK